MTLVDARVAGLRRALADGADPKTKAWFEAYLKGAIPYRGLKTPEVARHLESWALAEGVWELDHDAQLAHAEALAKGAHAEDKFAAFLILQRLVRRRSPAEGILAFAEGLFRDELVPDWSTNDWLCVRALGPLLARDGRPVAERLAGWRQADGLWQRRSSIVPFRSVTRDPAFHGDIEAAVDALVADPRRFIQTGIGWVLADLARHAPERATRLVERHLERLDREVIDRHTKRLPRHAAYRAAKRTHRPPRR
ncbi:MAG TPA: DNA alkylation repair protein [Polyangiaceae bacterium LLY-WYZ-14_1]|nr:DNA alkylation repair protein [Polyangiaceae bacterium LLY-WYZ-14_1]